MLHRVTQVPKVDEGSLEYRDRLEPQEIPGQVDNKGRKVCMEVTDCMVSKETQVLR